MALKFMARIALRPPRVWLIGIVSLALLTTSGCGNHHRRATLRPVYTAPQTIAAPCTNCGAGAGSAPVITAPSSPGGMGSTSRSLSSEPAIDEPAGGVTESSVPALGSQNGSSRSSQRSPLPERAPRASIGSEPDLNMIPSQSTRPRGTTSSPSPTPSAKPPLSGPGTSGSSSMISPDGLRTTSASGPVRQASFQKRLSPYFGESGGDELFYPSKADRPWKYIVLHHSASTSGSYDQIDREHRKVLGYDGCGYHFVIGNGSGSEDGQIEVAQRWVNQKHGVHCRNAKSSEIDEYGIGICFVGDLDKEPPTPRQVAAARALVAYLSARYGIARARVETHAHLAATPTVCPGRHFPIDSLLADDARPNHEKTGVNGPVPTAWRVARGPGLETR